MAFGKIKTLTMVGFAALTLGGAMIASAAPAEAGYRGAYYGGYRPYYRPVYYARPYYRPRYGGAVAAGLVGGLALGALAASSAYAAPAYPVAAPAYAYGPSCTVSSTRYVDDWGRVVIRRTKVCD